MTSNATGGHEVVSTPKGGGALRGIGETFSPDLFTGTGNFAVPIAVPPGRNGFEPRLSLAYSTGSGNGPYGLGWSLAIPGVSRQTSKGIPRYRDGAGDARPDVFVLSGSEDLVPVDGGPSGGQRYRPRTEGLFGLIDRFRGTADDYWRVKCKDGLTSFYGTASAAGNDPAAIAKPDDRRRAFCWKLTRTEDPFGNRIEYEYRRDKSTDGPHQWDQLYLERIRYADYTAADGSMQFLVSVSFVYDDQTNPDGTPILARRPDPYSEYRAGFEIRTRRRCKWIVIRTHAGRERLQRAYELVYLDERSDVPGLAALLPSNGVSLLSQIHVVGYDDAGQPHRELPPLDFGYSRFEPAQRTFFPITGAELPPVSLSSPDLALVDLFGSGLPDILEMNGSVRYWRNLGAGRFASAQAMREAPAGVRLADAGVQLIDANGDGRADLLVTDARLPGYYPLNFGGGWDHGKSFQRYRQAPTFDLEDPEVRLVDLDGDGVTDAIRSGARMECYFNDAERGWQTGPGHTRFIERQALAEFPDVSFSDERVRWADMSGDGMQDIALVHDGAIEYWPNLGYGDWGKRVVMTNAPRFADRFDPARVLLGDVDGDGLADIVYVEDGKVTLWINRAGSGWSDPITIHGTPAVSDSHSARLVDLLGCGVAGVLWTRDATGDGRPASFFLDFTGGTKPYLLTAMDNNLGAVTTVSYAASTRFYLADETNRAARWKTPLPFPVQLVERVEIADEISGGKLTTEYRYHHGYWDGAEREFRGFGMVEHLDTEIFDGYAGRGLPRDEAQLERLRAQRMYSQPQLTRTWFHQGPVGEEFGEWAEQDYSAEFWSGDAQLLDHKLGIDAFLATLPARRIRRDALRALRGSMLRTELYALDGSAREDRPYTVTESAYGLKEIEPVATPSALRFRIFFPHAVAQRTTQWERGDDPMTSFSYTADYDDYGQSRRAMVVACPRGWRGPSTALPGTYIASMALTEYATPLDPEVYIRDRVARKTGYEVVNPPGTARTLQDILALAGTGMGRRLIAQSLDFYDGDIATAGFGGFVGLPFGRVGRYGAPVRTDTLVMNDDVLQAAYGANIPRYLVPGATMVASVEYPAEFVNALAALGSYTHQSGGTNSPYAAGHFVSVASRRDFHNAAGAGRGLVLAQRDPLGHETTIDYDEPYRLFPTSITNAANLETHSDYDYRVMQPRRVTDPNGNVSEIAFTASGLVKEIRAKGNPAKTEGDRLAAGTRFEYHLRAFYDSRRTDSSFPQPAYARAIKRVFHDTDPADTGETIETRHYSDGFGRPLQTRAQAQDVTFGDPVGGHGLLPSDQNADAATRAGFTGQSNIDRSNPNVVVSAWQVYDNKGHVVESYEPFFAAGWNLQREAQARQGVHVTMYYDPRGQVVRTVNPDGSEQRVVYGVPADLSDPSSADGAPTPWFAYTYDANDNAGRTHATDPLTADYRHHWNTPASTEFDSLGRVVKAVARHREAPPGPTAPLPQIEEHVTRSVYDVQGNRLAVADSLGRIAFRYTYDFAGRTVRSESLDAGWKIAVFDAAANVVEARDAKGAIALRRYDALNRPIGVWARDDAGDAVTLREKLIYGDDASLAAAAPAQHNLRGMLHQHFDESGAVTVGGYDFKGNVLESSRRVISDSFMLANVRAQTGPTWPLIAPRVDWAAPPADLLDVFEYRTRSAFDALGRIQWAEYPECANGERYRLRPQYNRAGALERVDLEGPLGANDTGPRETYVERLAYNARGQRTLIAYGNGLITRYAYDDETFRLKRLRTERCTITTLQFQPTGAPYQDIAYAYDLAGNIVATRDRTPGCGVTGNLGASEEADAALRQLLTAGDALVRRFEYDPLYRLTAATGRACASIQQPRPWSDEARCGFDSGNHGTPDQDNAPDLAALYREEYSYDPGGNMASLRHRQLVRRTSGAAWDTLWSRHFGMHGFEPAQWQREAAAHIVGDWPNPPGNRLTHVEDRTSGAPTPASVPQSHYHDDKGNLVREHGARHFEWDHGDRLKAFRTQAGASEPSVYAIYLYDSSGQRVKKLVRRQGGQIETTVYATPAFEHHRRAGVGATMQNNTLHVMDDKRRVACVRSGGAFPNDGAAAHPARYHLGDHLGSSVIVVSLDGTWMNREEFFPYGESSFGSFGRKRYRYAGQERDEESGLNYHAARYCAPGIARWVSCDPLGAAAGLNPYVFVGSNPLNNVDPSGLALQDPSYPLSGPIPQITNVSSEQFEVIAQRALAEQQMIREGFWNEAGQFVSQPGYEMGELIRTNKGNIVMGEPGLGGIGAAADELAQQGEFIEEHTHPGRPGEQPVRNLSGGDRAYQDRYGRRSQIIHTSGQVTEVCGTGTGSVATETYTIRRVPVYAIRRAAAPTESVTRGGEGSGPPKDGAPTQPGRSGGRGGGGFRSTLSGIGGAAKFGLGVAGLVVPVVLGSPDGAWGYNTDTAEQTYLLQGLFYALSFGNLPAPVKPPHMGGEWAPWRALMTQRQKELDEVTLQVCLP